REAPPCGGLMSTAKMTLLPANDVPSPRKTLQNDMRLDDSLGSSRRCWLSAVGLLSKEVW
ncbi:hypothetical protein, partial [Paracoccus nototheniae]|uniref:hypothetical protein n=1 Tax=Paracoccus nototheniae TaxID=2489002 RepID=UPI001A955C6C